MDLPSNAGPSSVPSGRHRALSWDAWCRSLRFLHLFEHLSSIGPQFLTLLLREQVVHPRQVHRLDLIVESPGDTHLSLAFENGTPYQIAEAPQDTRLVLVGHGTSGQQ